MAGGDKKTKTAAPKAEPAKKSAPKEAGSRDTAKAETAPKADAAAGADNAPAADAAPKAEATPDAAPSNYIRGEGQKAVTKAYRDNWAAIFGDKKKR